MITGDHHFELLPSLDGDDGMPFGIGLDVSLDEDGFAPGSTDWAIQDDVNPQNGSTAFGRDRLLGPTWNWQLHVNRDDQAGALQTYRAFKSAWTALQVRDTPGAVLPLRFQIEGERRRVYGRPRRFEGPPDNRILSGYVPLSVDFKCVDGFVYDDVMEEVVMQLGLELDDPEAGDSGGGFVFPLIFPVVSFPPTRQRTQVDIGGDAPAYPIIRFTGPVLNPGIITDNWEIKFDYNLPEGQYIEIDTRPWRMTATLGNGFSVAGKMGARQRLSKVRFDPDERFEAKFIGSSAKTATCSIKWARTWTSW